jgi:hypothetical protein
MEVTQEMLMDFAEEAIVLEGFDDCIVGLTEEFGNGFRVLYSVKCIVKKLMQDGMSEEESLEYYGYNILNAHMGEQNPIFLVDILPY